MRTKRQFLGVTVVCLVVQKLIKWCDTAGRKSVRDSIVLSLPLRESYLRKLITQSVFWVINKISITPDLPYFVWLKHETVFVYDCLVLGERECLAALERINKYINKPHARALTKQHSLVGPSLIATHL